MDYQGEFTGPQIDARLRLAGSAYQKPEGGIPETDLSEGVQESLQEAGTAYQKPENGIPATDLAEGVQESLQRGDSAYQKPVDGIPASDLAEGVQESLTRADTAYQKPASGIPKTDLAEGVQQSLDNGDSALSGVNGILPLIPSAASSLNKLADQALVQHLVQLMQASFCGNWDDWASVPSIAGDFSKIPDNNDYLVVLNASDYAPLYNGDATYSVGDIRTYNGTLYKALQDNFSGILPTDTNYWEAVDENPKYAGTWIFKYVPVDETYNKYNWFPEFKISDVPFTQEQMAAINSGINSLLVAKLTNLPAKPVDTAAQTLSDAEKAQARTNIGATAPEVFWAVYGSTTAAEIDAAVAAGKVVMCKDNNGFICFLVSCSVNTNNIGFLSGYSSATRYVILKRDTGNWIGSSLNLQIVNNLVTSWQPTPDNTHYPAEKLVKDSLDAITPFVGIYNSTTFAEISAALTAGKEVWINRNGRLYQYSSGIAEEYSYYLSPGMEGTDWLRLKNATNEWVASSKNFQDSANKVTSLSASSTNNEYPGAKAVYDFVKALADANNLTMP